MVQLIVHGQFMWHSKTLPEQQGFVLLGLMALLLVLTTLVLSVSETALMEVKMDKVIAHQIQARTLAQTHLLGEVQNLIQGGGITSAEVQSKLLDIDICGGKLYAITAMANVSDAKANIHADVYIAAKQLLKGCDKKTKILSWRSV